MRARRLVLASLALVACLVWAAVAIPLAGMLGLWGPRHYLVLAQNEDELRPTGGFITGVALVTFAGGRVSDIQLSDANSVDDLSQVYPPPPDPLARYMGSQSWLLRDANWSPDFPTSARQAATLYQIGRNVHIDGVVAFDEAALRSVLAVVGPVSVPGLPEPVTDGNFLTLLRTAWSAAPGSAAAANWRTDRKDFMGPLAKALLDRLKSERDLGALTALAGALRSALDRHDVLIYAPGPLVAGWLDRTGWDGALSPGGQDYLHVVDANVGFNKVNAAIDEAISDRVDLSNPGQPAARLTVTYTNTVATPKDCVQFGVANHSTQYSDYLLDCYWDYWRVLLPPGAQVSSAPDDAVPGSELLSGQATTRPAQVSTGDAGTTQVAGLFVLPTGQSRAPSLSYALPASVLAPAGGARTAYRLRVQKQPGTGALPLDLTIAYPVNWSVQSTSAPASANTPGQARFSLSLETDLDFEVVFQHP